MEVYFLLRKVRFMNFQSYVDLTYDFAPGLNVIIAENNSGKSILHKFIDLVVNSNKYSTSQRQQFIRFGARKSDVYVHLEDGIYWIEIYPKVTYYHKGDSLTRMVSLGEEMPWGLKKGLSLLVCEDGLIGNLIDDDHSKFLVDSDNKINNAILGLLTRDERAEKVIEGVTEKVKEVTSAVRMKVNERNIYEKELSNIKVSNINYLQRVVDNTTLLIFVQDKLVTAHEKLSSVDLNSKVDKRAKPVMDLVGQLETIKYKLDEIRVVKECKIDNRVLSLLSSLEGVRSNLDRVQLKSLPPKSNLVALKSLTDIYLKLLEVQKLDSTIKDLKESNEIIKSELDYLKGEVYDCPIYGTIKLVDEECIPYNY